MHRIAVGTTNPAKLTAVRRAVLTVWPTAEIMAVAVESGVAEQPRTDAEAIAGATNRARAALAATTADLAIGLEGGTTEIMHGMLLNGWVVALATTGTIGVGCSGGALLPEKIAAQIRAGGELGPLMDTLTGQKNTKHDLGTVGILTGGRLVRADAFERGVLCALTPFIVPDLYRA